MLFYVFKLFLYFCYLGTNVIYLVIKYIWRGVSFHWLHEKQQIIQLIVEWL